MSHMQRHFNGEIDSNGKATYRTMNLGAVRECKFCRRKVRIKLMDLHVWKNHTVIAESPFKLKPAIRRNLFNDRC